MKKILTLILLISVFTLSGCDQSDEMSSDIQNNTDFINTNTSQTDNNEIPVMYSEGTSIEMNSGIEETSNSDRKEFVSNEIFMYKDGIYEENLSFVDDKNIERTIKLLVTISDDKIFAIEFISSDETILSDPIINSFTTGATKLYIGNNLNKISIYSSINGNESLAPILSKAMIKIKNDSIKKVEVIEVGNEDESSN
jgi:hypothetical protein